MIKYLNDAKLKPQSHEGRFAVDGSTPDWNFTISVSAYGPNQAHVRMHLRSVFDEIIRAAQKAMQELDFTTIKLSNFEAKTSNDKNHE